MNDWKLIDESTGNVSHFDTRADAQERKQDIQGLTEGPLKIEHVDGKTDGGEAEVVETHEDAPVDVPEDTPEEIHEEVDLPDDPGIDENPIDYMPGHFVDTIQGVPTLNKMGYAVMAEHFGVTVKAEPVVRASENDFEYAEFKAVAQTKDGTEYSGFGSAHIERQDGDDQYLLNELAETRAMKRAASWALGVGMTAKEEMEGSL